MIEFRKATAKLIGVYKDGVFQFYLEKLNRSGSSFGRRLHWTEWFVHKLNLREETLTKAKAKITALLEG